LTATDPVLKFGFTAASYYDRVEKEVARIIEEKNRLRQLLYHTRSEFNPPEDLWQILQSLRLLRRRGGSLNSMIGSATSEFTDQHALYYDWDIVGEEDPHKPF
jgi:non-homologous end joining protein Ku